MANPFKGEGELVAGETRYRLVLDINAMIEAEDVSGLDTAQLLAGLTRSSLKVLRAILYGALRRHHDDMHLIATGELIGEVGANAVREQLLKIMEGAMPPAEKSTRPRKAAGGTG